MWFIFMTWASKDKPEQTEKLEKAYLNIASKTGGIRRAGRAGLQ